MQELTKAEEKIMQLLWDAEKAFVKELIEKIEGKKPSYTTVSTIIRILETKKFVGHKAYGNTHQYFPLVSREEYAKFATRSVLDRYFDGSFKKLVSFFAKKEEIDIEELDDIMKMMEKEDQKKEEEKDKNTKS